MPTKTYSQEFKLEVAMQVVDYGRSVIDVAQAMGLGKSTVARWVSHLRKERQGLTTGALPITAEQHEIRQLKLKIKRLEEDNSILKKASALLKRTHSKVCVN